jgi:hypothetical protein
MLCLDDPQENLPSSEVIKELYEEKIKNILFDFNDQILSLEEEIRTAKTAS